MLSSQLCKSTKVVDAANSTVQKYKGPGCCNINCAKSPFQLVRMDMDASIVQEYKGRGILTSEPSANLRLMLE